MSEPRRLYLTARPFGKTYKQIMLIVDEAKKEYPNTFKLEIHPSKEYEALKQKADKLARALKAYIKEGDAAKCTCILCLEAREALYNFLKKEI